MKEHIHSDKIQKSLFFKMEQDHPLLPKPTEYQDLL